MNKKCVWCGDTFKEEPQQPGRFPVQLKEACSIFCSETIRQGFGNNTRKIHRFVNHNDKRMRASERNPVT